MKNLPHRRPTIERDGGVIDADAETALTHVLSAALILGFGVYAWRTGMSVSDVAWRAIGAVLAYFASRRLTALFGDWKAWRLRGAATLWAPPHLQFAITVVAFALARQLPNIKRDPLIAERRLFGVPSEVFAAAAVYAAIAFSGPHLPREWRALLMLDQFSGTFTSISPPRP